MRSSQRSASALAVIAIVMTLGARASAEGGEPCSGLVVRGDAELASRVREALEGRDDVDTCARVKITTGRGAIAVEVELPDGRSTSRSVSRREDVVPMVQALLLVPRSAEPESAPAPDERSASDDPTPPPSSPPRPTSSEGYLPSDMPPSADTRPLMIVRSGPPRRVLLELSVSTGGRVTNDKPSVAFGMQSFVDIGGWLAGFAGRADVSQGIVERPRGTTFSFGLVGGRRLRSRVVTLDIYGGPSLTAVKGSGDADGPSEVVLTRKAENTGPQVVPRLVVGSRLSFLPRSVLRPFVGIDGDFGPRGGADGAREDVARDDEHRLPSWSLGGAIGATVGTL